MDAPLSTAPGRGCAAAGGSPTLGLGLRADAVSVYVRQRPPDLNGWEGAQVIEPARCMIPAGIFTGFVQTRKAPP